MKWLSVKKYHIPSDMLLFVHYSNKITQNTFISVGEYKRHEWEIWEKISEVCMSLDVRKNYEVTHFCIPDPVEIEEEKLIG